MPLSRNVSINPAAEIDFADILQYTSTEWGEAQAYEYMGELMDSIDSPSHFGEMGQERYGLVIGLRSFPSREHVIFYSLGQSKLVIWRFLHKRRVPMPVDFR